MLVRSELVDLRPFRTGLVVGFVGLMIALGEDHGGGLGAALGGGLARVLGGAGSLIVGVALLLAGTLLVTGASAGAFLRRSGHAVRQAGTAARRSIESIEWADWSDSASSVDGPEPDLRPSARGAAAPVDGMEASPTSWPQGRYRQSPHRCWRPEREDASTADDTALVFHAPTGGAQYRLPTGRC